MPIKILEDGRLSDDFEMGIEPFIFHDAIVMNVEEYGSLTPDEIQAIKQNRYDNWISIVNQPQSPE